MVGVLVSQYFFNKKLKEAQHVVFFRLFNGGINSENNTSTSEGTQKSPLN